MRKWCSSRWSDTQIIELGSGGTRVEPKISNPLHFRLTQVFPWSWGGQSPSPRSRHPKETEFLLARKSGQVVMDWQPQLPITHSPSPGLRDLLVASGVLLVHTHTAMNRLVHILSPSVLSFLQVRFPRVGLLVPSVCAF